MFWNILRKYAPNNNTNIFLNVMKVETFGQQSFNVLVGEIGQAWYSVIT